MKAQCNLLLHFYLGNFYFIHVSMESYIGIGICTCVYKLRVVGFVVKKHFLILFLPSQVGPLMLPELCAYFHPCFHHDHSYLQYMFCMFCPPICFKVSVVSPSKFF